MASLADTQRKGHHSRKFKSLAGGAPAYEDDDDDEGVQTEPLRY